jgi:hypothetical protein
VGTILAVPDSYVWNADAGHMTHTGTMRDNITK